MNKKYNNNICIFGLGYVGLTLSIALAEKKYKIYGIEKNKNTILQIVVVKREEKILILMPFVINIRFGLNILVWHGENYCDYLSPIISKDYK